MTVLFFPVISHAKEDYSIILKRNVFTAPPPPPPAPKTILKPVEPPPPPPLESRIEIRLIGFFPEADRSFVVLKKKSQSDEISCRTGEMVEGARILKIEAEKVIFEYDGKTVAMNIDDKVSEARLVPVGENISVAAPEPPPEAAGVPAETDLPVMPEVSKPVAVDLAGTIEDLKNDKDLMKKINVTPAITGGRVDGFKIANLPEDSVPYQYGLRNGDIIHRVNGVLIDSLSRGMAVYNDISKSGTKLVTVEVLRNGSPLILTYQLQ